LSTKTAKNLENPHPMNELDSSDFQMMAWQIKYEKALESQQAFELLIDLLQQYNEMTIENTDTQKELALAILKVRNQCFDVPTFFAHVESFDTYFHGVTKDWFLFSTHNIKWARAKDSNETILLDEFPDIFPIDPLRVITIVPRVIIDQILGIGSVSHMNPVIKDSHPTIDIVIEKV